MPENLTTHDVRDDIELPGVSTLAQAFQRTVARQDPTKTALRTLDSRLQITWGDYATRVRRITEGLHALGLRRGDTLATMMVNRPEFQLLDTSAIHLGVTSFSLYNTLPVQDIRYQLEDSGARLIVTEPQFLDRILAARPATLATVVLVEGSHAECTTLAQLEQMRSAGFDFDASWRAVQAADVLTLIYTSGTTGAPKGVELTHAGMLFQIRSLGSRFAQAPGDVALSYLPAAHLADRWTAHYWPSLCRGATVVSVGDVTRVAEAYVQARPKLIITVPRFFEKLYEALNAQGLAQPSTLDAAQRRQILERIGFDRLEYPVVGGAPVAEHLQQFFADLGLPIMEAWGMTETGGITTVGPRDAVRIGTAGQPLPGYEVSRAADGELLVRGAGLMRGYRNAPAKTAEVLDADGWLHTGHLGTIDADGYVKIVDRKKEIIINSAGKNMSPVNIERQLKAASPLLAFAVCIGDARRYNVALLVLAPDSAAAWARKRGLSADASSLPALAGNTDLLAELGQAVQHANEGMARAEQIKRFAVLPHEWQPAGDELTPTSKLKRKAIAGKYADVIETLYQSN